MSDTAYQSVARRTLALLCLAQIHRCLLGYFLSVSPRPLSGPTHGAALPWTPGKSA